MLKIIPSGSWVEERIYIRNRFSITIDCPWSGPLLRLPLLLLSFVLLLQATASRAGKDSPLQKVQVGRCPVPCWNRPWETWWNRGKSKYDRRWFPFSVRSCSWVWFMLHYSYLTICPPFKWTLYTTDPLKDLLCAHSADFYPQLCYRFPAVQSHIYIYWNSEAE